jgi:hypothetical protein
LGPQNGIRVVFITPTNGDYVFVHDVLYFSVRHRSNLWNSLGERHLGDYEKLGRSESSSAIALIREKFSIIAVRTGIGLSHLLLLNDRKFRADSVESLKL